ncbi:MAG: TonB-dependent receptor [Prolixibacteraceae bacterium]|jgi:TonB-linked SusC/RagA family outer membrane protein|nr:TonB-dependent receptor [Prolixibacteraceae bacterium]
MMKNRNSLVNQKSSFKTMLLLVFLLVFQFSVFAQEKQVTGTVFDESGETLPGVNVLVKGTTIGTVTNIDGNYSITVDAATKELLYSFVGYLDQTVAIGNKSEISITLEEDILEMDEVIVVGYGTQKKSDLTGSVASVSAESLEKLPSSRIDEALQGKAAGVVVLQNSGQPGSAPAIRVRGLATINGGSPLIVVDGISGGSLANINPADIESIEVLKDAASQGIYGSAGGNGVILVTTKKGKVGKLQTKLDIYAGLQEPWIKILNIADAQQYAAMLNQYNQSKELEDYFPQNESGQYLNPENDEVLSSTNWADEIFRLALVQNYNLSVSGGKENAKFFFGTNYNAQEGTVKKTSNDRFSVRLNSEFKLFDKVTIGENFSVTNNVRSGTSERNEYSSPLSTSIQMLPFVPVFATDGSENYAYKHAGKSSNIQNPMSQIEYSNNQGTSNSLFGNAFARIEIIKGLTFESRIGISMGNSLYKSFLPVYVIGDEDNSSPSQSNSVSTYTRNTTSNSSWQLQNFINYSFSIMEKNNFTVTVGQEAGASKYEFKNTQANNVDIETDEWMNYEKTDSFRVLGEKPTPTSGYAYFGRVTYDYDGLLLFQANIRRDHSSKLGPNNRVGNFPSASAGLKFSEFDFIKNLNIIDFGKIRFGYGATGNSDIQPFLYLNSMGPVDMTGYAFGGVTQEGAALLTAANPDLKWETVLTQNIGTDLRFLNNRLGVTVDLFSRKNIDMLLRKSVPLTVGYYITDAFRELGDAALDTRPLVNYGTLNNRGFEVTVTYKDQVGKLKYNLNANITRAVTTIDDIGDPLYAGSGRGITNVTRTMNGMPVSAFYGYKTDGVYQEDDFVWYQGKGDRWISIAPDENGTNVVEGTYLGQDVSYNVTNTSAAVGNLKYIDTDGDGNITVADMVQIGDPNPDFIFGFGADFEYQNFDLNLFFQGSYGNDIFNLMKVNLYTVNNGSLNLSNDLINSYIPATYNSRDKTVAPELVTEARNTDSGILRMDGDLQASDFYVEDGSYIRLKNIQLGYTIPLAKTQKMKIQRLRLYVGAKNLLTLTNYSGFDPEVGETTILERGFDRGTYPQSKMYTFGVNLIF